MEFMLSVAELSLSQCFMLAFTVALLDIHKHRLVSQLCQWQSMGDVSKETMVATVVMVDKLKNFLKHVMFLMDWVRMHGELALLYAEDLRYFIRPRRQRVTEVCLVA